MGAVVRTELDRGANTRHTQRFCARARGPRPTRAAALRRFTRAAALRRLPERRPSAAFQRTYGRKDAIHVERGDAREVGTRLFAMPCGTRVRGAHDGGSRPARRPAARLVRLQREDTDGRRADGGGDVHRPAIHGDDRSRTPPRARRIPRSSSRRRGRIAPAARATSSAIARSAPPPVTTTGTPSDAASARASSANRATGQRSRAAAMPRVGCNTAYGPSMPRAASAVASDARAASGTTNTGDRSGVSAPIARA